jgi:hypothetical protein
VTDQAEVDDRAQVVIDRINEIHDSLDSLRAEVGAGLGKLLAAYGWWTRIVRTARAIELLHQAGLAHEASPLVRALLHHGVALKWLVEHPDEALPALVWEHKFQASRMLNKALERAWDLDPDIGPEPPAKEAPDGYHYLKNTEALCARVDMPHAYVAFLSESKFTHPTGISADAYLTDVDGPLMLLRDPEVHTPLRGIAVFAAESTGRFASLAGLHQAAAEANALAESLIAAAEKPETPIP